MKNCGAESLEIDLPSSPSFNKLFVNHCPSYNGIKEKRDELIKTHYQSILRQTKTTCETNGGNTKIGAIRETSNALQPDSKAPIMLEQLGQKKNRFSDRPVVLFNEDTRRSSTYGGREVVV